jgi:hypothetical protein
MTRVINTVNTVVYSTSVSSVLLPTPKNVLHLAGFCETVHMRVCVSQMCEVLLPNCFWEGGATKHRENEACTRSLTSTEPILPGLWSWHTKPPTSQFLNLRLLHKSSICVNNGKPAKLASGILRHFITTRFTMQLFRLITYI